MAVFSFTCFSTPRRAPSSPAPCRADPGCAWSRLRCRSLSRSFPTAPAGWRPRLKSRLSPLTLSFSFIDWPLFAEAVSRVVVKLEEYFSRTLTVGLGFQLSACAPTRQTKRGGRHELAVVLQNEELFKLRIDVRQAPAWHLRRAHDLIQQLDGRHLVAGQAKLVYVGDANSVIKPVVAAPSTSFIPVGIGGSTCTSTSAAFSCSSMLE